MHAIRRSPFTRFFVVPVTLLALFSGCHKWTTVWEPGAPSTSWEGSERIRVTYDAEAAAYERTVLLESAIVFGDSLVGDIPTGERVGASGVPRVRPQRLAIPSAHIARIEERQRSAAPMVVGAIVGVAAIVGLVFAFKSMDLGPDFSGMDFSDMDLGLRR